MSDGRVQYGPAIDRLLSRCVQEGDCWIFTGPLDRKGYARIRGDERRKEFGHWIAWKYFRAERPAGLTYDHLCERKACVNPWHGDPVPSGINSKRSAGTLASINGAKTHCPRGHAYGAPGLHGRECKPCHLIASRKYREKAAA